jgi:hypothetical protein
MPFPSRTYDLWLEAPYYDLEGKAEDGYDPDDDPRNDYDPARDQDLEDLRDRDLEVG